MQKGSLIIFDPLSSEIIPVNNLMYILSFSLHIWMIVCIF